MTSPTAPMCEYVYYKRIEGILGRPPTPATIAAAQKFFREAKWSVRDETLYGVSFQSWNATAIDHKREAKKLIERAVAQLQQQKPR